MIEKLKNVWYRYVFQCVIHRDKNKSLAVRTLHAQGNGTLPVCNMCATLALMESIEEQAFGDPA